MGVKNRLKEIRMKEYMKNKTDFAALLGEQLSTYSQWESGINRPTLERAMEIARILNKTIEEIWYFE